MHIVASKTQKQAKIIKVVLAQMKVEHFHCIL